MHSPDGWWNKSCKIFDLGCAVMSCSSPPHTPIGLILFVVKRCLFLVAHHGINPARCAFARSAAAYQH